METLFRSIRQNNLHCTDRFHLLTNALSNSRSSTLTENNKKTPRLRARLLAVPPKLVQGLACTHSLIQGEAVSTRRGLLAMNRTPFGLQLGGGIHRAYRGRASNLASPLWSGLAVLLLVLVIAVRGHCILACTRCQPGQLHVPEGTTQAPG